LKKNICTDLGHQEAKKVFCENTPKEIPLKRPVQFRRLEMIDHWTTKIKDEALKPK
jgi:hypothetical protein